MRTLMEALLEITSQAFSARIACPNGQGHFKLPRMEHMDWLSYYDMAVLRSVNDIISKRPVFMRPPAVTDLADLSIVVTGLDTVVLPHIEPTNENPRPTAADQQAAGEEQAAAEAEYHAKWMPQLKVQIKAVAARENVEEEGMYQMMGGAECSFIKMKTGTKYESSK